MSVLGSVSALDARALMHGRGGEQQMHEAVLRSFCDPLPEICAPLFQLSVRQGQRLLPWLDSSGLALYFLDRVAELQLQHCLPAAMLARLQENLADNTARIHTMIEQSVNIQREFQSAGVSYAVLKGFSLWPYSVPKLELRSQLDLDFLVAAEHALRARQILERHGYRLQAVSGRSWEFKTSHLPSTSLKNLYKNVPNRSIELHLEIPVTGKPPLLARLDTRVFHDLRMPVLPPADLLLGQALHLHKHICSEFTRAAHLLEFRRHVLHYRSEADFWTEFIALAERNPRATLAIGVTTRVATHLMGPFAPEELIRWTRRQLPPAVQLWVNLYAGRSVLAGFPGSKLYLFLQREVQAADTPPRRPLQRALLPLRLPPPIVQAPRNESLRQRTRRYHLHVHFILLRLRFHVVEGLRYLWESRRWHRHRRAC